MNLKINDIIEVTCFEVDYNGNGVSRYNNLIVFTKGLLVDEKAKVVITKVQKKFLNAKILNLITKNTDRKDLLHNLNALDLFHLNENMQNKWQITTTIKTFNKIAKIELDDNINIISNNEYLYYRNKSVFHVLNNKQLTLGLYDNDYNLVKVDNFLLSSKITNKALSEINSLAFDLKHLQGNLKHIVFRNNQKQELMIILVLNKLADVLELQNELTKISDVKSIYLNINKSNKSILGTESYLLFGKEFLIEEYDDIALPFNDQSFLQINTNIANQVYQIIKNHIPNNKIVIDAYSGVGGIGSIVSKNAKKVYLLESNLASVNISRNIVNDYNFKNIEVIQGDVIHTIKEIDGDILIVDPPRSGLNNKFIETILSKDIKKIIYLSCDIKTQARDIDLLSSKYEISNVYPIKMFYQTTSIENLIILNKKSA